MRLASGMGDAKAVAGPLPVPTQVAAQAAAETFKKSRRELSFFILISPSHSASIMSAWPSVIFVSFAIPETSALASICLNRSRNGSVDSPMGLAALAFSTL